MRGLNLRTAKGFVGRPWINLARFGCTNRPFYLVCVFPPRSYGRQWEGNIVEQIGIFDPLPNKSNEKVVSFNYDRVKYWLAKDAHVSKTVLKLLELSGFLPIHPETFIEAREAQEKKRLASAKLYEEGESAESENLGGINEDDTQQALNN